MINYIFFNYLKSINIIKQLIRNIRQDTGYSTSSSRTSPKINKTHKNDKRRVLTRHREVIDSEEFNDIDDNDVNIKRSKNKRLKKDDYKITGNDKERGKMGKNKKKVTNLTSVECEEKNISISKSNSETDTESDYRYINFIFFFFLSNLVY